MDVGQYSRLPVEIEESQIPRVEMYDKEKGEMKMTLNRTVSDLKVKTVKVKKRSGSSWITPPEPWFVANQRYRLDLLFGNTDGKIAYPDEQYRKDNVEIRVLAKGFHVGPQKYKEKTKLIFYTNSNYSTKVSGTKYLTIFKFEQYKTVYADSLLMAYFKMSSGITALPIPLFRWDIGIYASVRDWVWRKPFSKV
jgi:hypothetical protein